MTVPLPSPLRLALNHQTAMIKGTATEYLKWLRLALNHQTAMIKGTATEYLKWLRLALNHQTAMIRIPRRPK